MALKKNAPSGGRHESFWGISCEKSRFYATEIIFFPILEGAPPVPPSSNFRGSAPRPPSSSCLYVTRQSVALRNRAPVTPAITFYMCSAYRKRYTCL